MPPGRAAPSIQDIEKLLRQAKWLDGYYASMRLATDPTASVDQRAVALALGAWAAASNGNADLAEQTARLAVEVAEASADRAVRARTVVQLGITQISAEHFEAAEATFRTYLTVADHGAAPEWTARALQGMGFLRDRVPDRADAIRYYEAGLDALKDADASLDGLRMELHLVLAMQYAKAGQAPQARGHLDAVTSLHPLEDPSAWRHLVVGIASATVARAEGRTDEAQRAGREVFNGARSLGNKPLLLDALEVLMRGHRQGRQDGSGALPAYISGSQARHPGANRGFRRRGVRSSHAASDPRSLVGDAHPWHRGSACICRSCAYASPARRKALVIAGSPGAKAPGLCISISIP